jgi:hypothetical protein
MRYHMPFETWFMGALTSPAFFLFTFFMITDPQTSPADRRAQAAMAASIVTIDFVLHLKLALSTLFFAAFACASLRLVWCHGYALLADARQSWHELRNTLLAAAKRFGAAALLGLSSILGLPQLMAAQGEVEADFAR